jgi:hypothetical protein
MAPTTIMLGPYRWVNTAVLPAGQTRTEQFDRFTFPGATIVMTMWPDPEEDESGRLVTESITATVDSTHTKLGSHVTFKNFGTDLRSYNAYITVIHL